MAVDRSNERAAMAARLAELLPRLNERDRLEKWLNFPSDDYSYSGVEMAAGSYESFLVAILRIVEAWIKDPRILDGKDPAPVGKPFQRTLKGIFHPDQKLGMSALKYEFNWNKFQLLKQG